MPKAQHRSSGRRPKPPRRHTPEEITAQLPPLSEPQHQLITALAGQATFVERLQRGAVSSEEYAEFVERLSAAVDALTTTMRLRQQRHAEGLDRFRDILSRGTPTEHSYAVLLGLSTIDFRGLLNSVVRGFSYVVFDRFVQNTGLPQDRLADWADIPRRTLVRRKREGRLSSEESDRMLRASRLFGKALQLFEGDRDAAVAWLNNEQKALGGARPIEVAKTDLGAREVENLIDRLEQGVFS
jgi:putative toxin-antitoxin system antitoxin component (TIGR02293 family)